MIASINLGGLSAAAAGPAAAQPYDAARCLPGAVRGALPADWSARRRMVHAAVCEWSKFGFPTVVVRQVPDDRTNRLPGELALSEPLSRAAPRPTVAAPGVARAVEVQVRFGRSESDLGVYDRVAAYWAATSPGYARVQQAQAALTPRTKPGWWVAWSAAFVSWTAKEAGVGWLPADDNHTAYLAAALRARPSQVVAADRFRPSPGDLLCFPRLSTEGEADERATPAAFLARLREGATFPAHCDIVVRRNDRSLVVIGGNVKNAVTATVVPLDARGRPLRTTVRPWTVGVRLDGPADPCARIEAVPLPGWTGLDTERARALGRRC